MANRSDTFEVILVGFPGLSQSLHHLVSAMMFLVYITSLVANGSVIILVTLNAQLHQPMYLIIASLAASDVAFDTATLPKLMAHYWFGSSTMSFHVCLFQMFWVHYLGSVDSFLLLLMAVDRYVAISLPLRYSTIIINSRMSIACGVCWIILAPPAVIFLATETSKLLLCDHSKLNSLFCVHTAVVNMACSDATFIIRLGLMNALIVLIVPLAFILFSYITIVATIAMSSQAKNWRKVFYTCSTHILLVSLYYGPRILVYIANSLPSMIVIKADVGAVLLFLYSVVPHLANPIVYFLRTKEIQQTLINVLRKLTVKDTSVN
ncbi:putative olfactory receptor 2W6 [Hyperolius riggenbachi]|uniref:putative olfactory receptor 2W6 n=1 Tax=Hyperolius riggenbachi TaxID=752182 RepID=UPI0035A38566